MKLPSGAHLTYCTNVHPGESLGDVLTAIETHVLEVKRLVSPGRPFGLGLRLSSRAAEELAVAGEIERLADLLARNDLYAFTVNGFPYGAFHATRVKEAVYLPDWRDEARIAYTDRLATLLAELLPDGVDGSVSTVPGAFRATVCGAKDVEAIARGMLRHAATLVELRQRTGRRVQLALEPEPCCMLETTAEAVRFFEEHLYRRESVERFAAATRLAVPDAERALRDHVGVCYDACHAAVEFEEPRAAIAALVAAGIPIAKVQVTAGLELEPTAVARAALAAFADDVYLHQVVARRGRKLERFVDLDEAFEHANGELLEGNECRHADEIWRVHFHVPVFCERFGPLRSTQADLLDLLDALCDERVTEHLEVETYTWDVIPEGERPGTLTSALARELTWTAEQLAVR